MTLAKALASKPNREQRPAKPITPRATSTDSHARRYALAALAKEVAELSGSTEGTRNDTLNNAAFALGSLVAAGALNDTEVEDALKSAAKACGLGDHEADATFASGFAAGQKEPREIPPEPERTSTKSERDNNFCQPEPSPADEVDAAPESETRKAAPLTPAGIIEGWRTEGPLIRVPTGIDALDRLSRGGLPVPWRVITVGAPSAGKTALNTIMADSLARAAGIAGLCVGGLAVDEEPDDITVRLAQIAGFTVEQAEQRDAALLAEMAARLEPLRLRLYDGTHTIEDAAEDLAQWCKAEGRRGMLMIDSLQAVSSLAGLGATNPREMVEGNVRAVRWASTHHGLLVVATSEANRTSYRNEDAAQTTNDLAAGAESRAIEFGAQTQLMLRTPKDHPDVIHVRVAKNRRADRGEFWLRLDRERHILTECPDPDADPATAVSRNEQKRVANRVDVQRDAEALATLMVRYPAGLGEIELRGTVKAAGHKWGPTRLEAARVALKAGHKGVRLVETRGHRGARLQRLERVDGGSND